ncbi:hypothetical protein HUB98_12685 [Paenibacillus barcinonensis]|uniref:SH3 domain-containing protein n=1 Tax=Paenibacillus barcinonensis TaxID=198119 RepID=A0A2V4VU56_PAEBA|nr:hypothetical protein [Paenibacillus barcinonensis]PYE45808.1 hypothetical protein DFQ00_11644 [Paenibacillus barcinonensis]QKS57087.1 hypothetical protein HUB98_12685 [Paenibacillus barcinonensis]
MKKIVSFAAALTLMGSMAAAAGAEEAVTGTVTPTTSGTEATSTTPAGTTPAVEVNKPAVETVEGKAETVTGTTVDSTGAQGTSTTTDTSSKSDIMFEEPLVKPGDEVVMPTMLLNLLERTWFYDAPNGKPIGALGAQVIDTTGEVVDGFDGGEWVQVYTWKGKAWIHVAIQ